MTATLTTLDVVVDPLGVGGHTVCNLQQQQATLATNDQMSGECHSVHSVWRPPRRVLLLSQLPLAKGFCARLENFFLLAISSYLHQTLSAFACCVFKFMTNVFFSLCCRRCCWWQRRVCAIFHLGRKSCGQCLTFVFGLPACQRRACLLYMCGCQRPLYLRCVCGGRVALRACVCVVRAC